MIWRAQRLAVRAAQAEAAAQRAALAAPTAKLATRIRTHPLTSLGIVAGFGFVFGQLRLPHAAAGTSGWLRDGALELAALWLRGAGKTASPEREGQPIPTQPSS